MQACKHCRVHDTIEGSTSKHTRNHRKKNNHITLKRKKMFDDKSSSSLSRNVNKRKT